MSLDVAELYTAWHPRVLAFFRQQLAPRDLSVAEDLAAATFLRVWAKRHLYQPRPGSGPDAWLFAVARNILLEYLRTERPVGSLDVRIDIGLEPTVPSGAPAVELSVVLEDALTHLTVKQRQVVVGHFYEGKLQRELTDIGRTMRGVQKLQQRALVNLRRALGVA